MLATFPAGTVSGAPKIRAMQIVADLAPWDNPPEDAAVRAVVYPTGREGTTRGPPRKASILDARRDSNPRGRYGGCVGYFSFNGNLDTCITIRPSPGLRPPSPAPAGEGRVQAGGGWVNDSEHRTTNFIPSQPVELKPSFGICAFPI